MNFKAKKAKELVDKGINTIDELRERQTELLNDIQRVGLKYYEQIQERIPRSEIQEYETMFKTTFEHVFVPDSAFEIVGSYRRGATTSGDIDVIITGKNGAIYNKFIDNNIHFLDEFGRNITISPKIDDNNYIQELSTYKIEEFIYDVQTDSRISLQEFLRTYVKKDKLYMISQIKNKFILQNEDDYIQAKPRYQGTIT